MNIKSTSILLISPLLLTNCALSKKNKSTEGKVKPTLVSERKKTPENVSTTHPVITPTESSIPGYLPTIPPLPETRYDEEAQVKNTAGLYPDLKNADDPATEEQVSQEVSPIIKAPANVITP